MMAFCGAAARGGEGGFIRPGFHAGLDKLVALSTDGKDFLLKIETHERERTIIGAS